MLINFALDTLGTTVACDKICVDGYECTNLIAAANDRRRKGFLAEPFLKPPVNIVVQFPCKVFIHKIVVLPSVQQQKSNIIKLFSASDSFISKEASTCEDSKKLDDSKPKYSTKPDYFLLSKVVTKGERTCFQNPKVAISSTGGSKNLITIRHFKTKLLTASSHLSIQIETTLNGSAAALSHLEIWGLPAKSVSSLMKRKIYSEYTKFAYPTHDSPATSFTPLEEINAKDIQSDIETPEEFLDVLTWEIMSIPILLPSGKNIDKSTLDTYIHNETACCRKPRDPFTGVEFSDTVQPLPNLALKARIDNFLMMHSNHKIICTVSRTVNDGVTSLLEKRQKTMNLHSNITLSDPQGVNQQNVHQIKHFQRRQAMPGNSQQTKDPNLASHEVQLKDSLNLALFSILHGLPSSEIELTNKKEVKTCNSCLESLSVESLNYMFPCFHYICRNCLLSTSVSSVVCKVCNISFEKNLIIKKA